MMWLTVVEIRRCMAGRPGPSSSEALTKTGTATQGAPMSSPRLDEQEVRISALIRAELSRLHRATDQDLFQEVWLVLLERQSRLIRTYDPRRGSFSSWIRKVIHNILVDCIRRSKIGRLGQFVEGDALACVDDQSSRSPSLEEKEIQALTALVHGALDELGMRIAPKNLEVLRLYLMGAQTVAAIARRLEEPPEKIRKRLERMKAKLKNLLSKHLDSDSLASEISDHVRRFKKKGANAKRISKGGGISGDQPYSLIRGQESAASPRDQTGFHPLRRQV